MFNQIIHKVGVSAVTWLILLHLASIVIGTTEPPSVLPSRIKPAGRSRSVRSRTTTSTTTPAPDVAPAPPHQWDYEGNSPSDPTTTSPPSTTAFPFVNNAAVQVGKGRRYDIVAATEGSPAIMTTPTGIYRIFSHVQGKELAKIGRTPTANADEDESEEEDVEDILETFINSRPDLRNNLDVITQAFRFVKLDAYLSSLVNQLNKLQESQEHLQGMTVKQETKFDILTREMKSLANSLSGESTKLKDVEERIESEMTTMNQRLDSAVEKIIKSSTVSDFLTDASKESRVKLDKMESLTEKVLGELQSVKTELGDVGHASIQAVFNVQKTEENLMTAMAGMENRTIYALRQESVPTLPASTTTTTTTAGLQAGSGENSHIMMADSNGIPRPRSGSVPAPTSSSPVSSAAPTCSHRNTMTGKPMDCAHIRQSGRTKSGVYKIYPSAELAKGVEVFCDMETDGGGWTVIQRRKDGQGVTPEDFFRSWEEYEMGFGSPKDHVWLGLSTLAELTAMGDQLLKIELMDWDGNSRMAQYGYFRVANSTDRYRLHITDYSGTAGDSMAYHNGMQFTTRDQDNDLERSTNCAQKYHGAWWYKNCHQANLNGQYMYKGGKHVTYATGINWYSWHGYYYSLRKSEMKIRDRHFSASTIQYKA